MPDVRPSCCPAAAATGHLKACHLADPDEIYRTRSAAEIAPELAQER